MSDASEKLAEAKEALGEFGTKVKDALVGSGAAAEYYDPAAILLAENVSDLHATVGSTIRKALTGSGGVAERVDKYEQCNLLMALGRDDQVASRDRLLRMAAAAQELELMLETNGGLDSGLIQVGKLP